MNFDSAFKKVIGIEGGYVNDPDDNGGETNFGISKRAYPMVDIKNLTLDEAKKIYKRDYWDAIQCDKLPYPIDVIVFDCAVNQGVSTAIKLLQKASGVSVDGKLGNVTLTAVRSFKARELAIRILTIRAQRYVVTDDFGKFGSGWFRRLFTLALDYSGV